MPSTLTAFLIGTVSIGIALLLGCLGETITEKSGHLNLGIPGIMSVGALGGLWGSSVFYGWFGENTIGIFLILFSILTCALFSLVMASIYNVLTVTLRSNQNITGLMLTTFGTGITEFAMTNPDFINKSNVSAASVYFRNWLPFTSSLDGLTSLFFGRGILVYIAIILALAAGFMIKRTRIGLNLRAVGENPATADAAGVNVTVYRYVATSIGSAIAGLGGFYYIIDNLSGSVGSYPSIPSIGWLSIALVIFTMWRPTLSILGSLIFGALYILPTSISGFGVSLSLPQMKLFSLLPYIMTIIVLIIVSALDSKENQPPASLSLNYFREER